MQRGRGTGCRKQRAGQRRGASGRLSKLPGAVRRGLALALLAVMFFSGDMAAGFVLVVRDFSAFGGGNLSVGLGGFFLTDIVLDDPERFVNLLELDRQGRILVPAAIRDEGGLVGKVLVIGCGDYLELWHPDRWAAERAALEADEGADEEP